MLSFESPQFEEIALASFEQRVRSWVQAQALVQPQPEMAMKRFLSERGYLRFSDFDLPLQDD